MLSAFVWGPDSTYCGTIWAQRRRRGSQRADHQLDSKSAARHQPWMLGEGQGEEHMPFLFGNQCCNYNFDVWLSQTLCLVQSLAHLNGPRLLSLSTPPSQPTLRDYQNGDGFGYILSFRKKGTQEWLTARVPHAESLHYVYRNESISPYTPFEVKIKAYNRKGEGPESLTAIVYSAEEGKEGLQGLRIHNVLSNQPICPQSAPCRAVSVWEHNDRRGFFYSKNS